MKKYTCKICGKQFDKLHELGSHVWSEKVKMMKQQGWRPQLTPPRGHKPKHHAILRIEKMGNSRRVCVTKLIPKDWNIVRAYTVEADKDEVWIHMERIG